MLALSCIIKKSVMKRPIKRTYGNIITLRMNGDHTLCVSYLYYPPTQMLDDPKRFNYLIFLGKKVSRILQEKVN